MIGRRIPVGDELLADGQSVTIEGSEYAVQKIQQRLQFFLGEWFLDTSLGVPWYERILVKNPDLRFVQGILRDEIAKVPGIRDVQSVEASLDLTTRRLTIAYQAQWYDATLVTDVFTTVIGP